MIQFSMFGRNINVDPDKTALISDEQELTYKQLDERISRTVSALTELGLQSGSKAAVLGSHNAEFIILILSLWRIGAVPVPLNNRLKDDELKTILRIADPFILLIDKTSGRKIESEYTQTAFPLAGESSQPEIQQLNSTDQAGIVIFTSGTTGIPKGVVLTVNNILSSAGLTNKILLPEKDDAWLCSLPFYHIGGIMIFVRALTAGLTVIIPDSPDTNSIASSIEKHRPSFASLVPTQLARLMENQIKPRSVKKLLLGGGPVDNKLANNAVTEGWRILKVYGSSETCSMFTGLSINENTEKLSSAGLPLPGNSLRIVNEERQELPPWETGEIAVSGPTIFREYLNNKEETEKRLQNGYYYTGDIGYTDDEGFLFIESRRTDLIISGGENISPAELETALLNITGIDKACVIGVPDEEWGQIPAAVLKSSLPLTEVYILDNLRTVLASYKLPKRFFFVEDMPENEMGKINRNKLRAIIQNQL